MTTRLTYELAGDIATIAMDDGKANVLSPAMLVELDAALDRAGRQAAVVVLTGRPGVFSGGFDLAVLRGGGSAATAMMRAGFELAERLLSFPRPVVVACTGHAVAMGVFLVLSGDHRIGAAGPYKLVANEVAIGVTMPRAAIELTRHRLTPAAFNRALLLAETFSPGDAVAAGFLDDVVAADEVAAAARRIAEQLAGLDRAAHVATKLRARGPLLEALRAGIEADHRDLWTLAPAGS